MPPLSKSKLLAFRQCHKRLWLEIHKPELREGTTSAGTRVQTGHQVGEIAKRLYNPTGKGSVIDVEADGFDGAFTRTTKLLAESSEPIFEAGFKTDGALAFADVMLPELESNQRLWRMVEVKSSTSVKDYHRDDIAVQTFLAQASGVKLKSVALAHLDSSWVYPGNEEYQGLLTENDLTAEAFARTEEVRGWIQEAQNIAGQSNEPAIAIGDHCYAPFECGFCNYCNKGISQPQFPVGWLPRFSPKKREKLAAHGVNELTDVPDDMLNEKQAMVKAHTLANKVFIDAAGAAADLADYEFPARFLDFESIQFAVPIWKGTRPYQQIVFQFSLHTVSEGGELSQTGFLNLSGEDPSDSFARALIAACGDDGPVFVYNQAFEKTRISELAERYPTLAKPLLAINARIVDLLPIARDRYYHPSQQGSWSIKAVLPTIAPELSYESLEGVQNGDMAMDAYCEAIRADTIPERKSVIEKQLIEYCGLDTLALVRLWQFFSGRSGEA